MKILITGVDGFVGGHLADFCVDQAHSVIGLSLTGQPIHEPIHHYYTAIQYYPCDLTYPEKIAEIINAEQPEAVVHLAAVASPLFSRSAAALTYRVNLLSTAHLIDAVCRYSPEARFLFISSSHVYQKTSRIIDEQAALDPLSPYAVSKLAGEYMIHEAVINRRLNAVIIRAFNHSGPGQKKGYVCVDLAQKVIETKNVMVTGSLEMVRDFMDVRDVARAYAAVITSPDFEKHSGRVFNLCSNEGRRVRDILDAFIRLSGRNITVQESNGEARNDRLVGSNTMFRNTFSWQPEIPFDKSLESVFQFETKHR